MAYTGNASGSLFAEGGAGTLKLLMYLTMALVLMVADHRGGYLDAVRAAAGMLTGPLYMIASSPARLVTATRDQLASQQDLLRENRELREQLLRGSARMNRLQAVQIENQRLRDLLGGTRGLQLSVQLAGMVDVDLDPFRHRIVLDAGQQRGVRVGLAVIDGAGVVGQIIATTPMNSTAMLVTDPSHAIPVQVVRSGQRSIAFGTGRLDALELPNIPLSADVQVGDELITSGLGGTFPAGFPVGRIVSLQPDDTRLFVVAQAHPAATLERNGEVLLVWNTGIEDTRDEMGPPAPDAAPTAASPSTGGGP
ncbi:rod shape-determining protein MreC [Chiayiivirga flava]|uniref:Cell shape-determining protein MreC n=1 Tax=Chiayiivirga flava TaxID=659595 RepID=A0A7W8D667_9GAMM|nr:rod shape-determining protein MreC [Chiayiivirga flava]